MADPPHLLPPFKLDLLTLSNAATALPLPAIAAPTCTSLLNQDVSSLDQQLASQPELVAQLEAILSNTDITYVCPSAATVAATQCPPSLLAQQVVQLNPNLFQYAVADVDMAGPGPAAAAVPAPPAANQVSGNTDTAAAARKDKSRAASDNGARKKARRTVVEDEYVGQTADPRVAAAKLAAHIEHLLAGAQQQGQHDREDGSDDGDVLDEEEDAGAGGTGPSSRAPRAARLRLRPAALKQLYDELLRAKLQDYMRLVPLPLLQRLLSALQAQLRVGHNTLLHDDADAKEFQAALQAVSGSLDAALGVLCLLSSSGLPPQLYLDELMEQTFGVLRTHLQYNVLPFYDVRFRKLYRPSSVDDDADEAQKGKGRGRPKSAHQQQPRWLAQLAGQVELGLMNLADLLAMVRPAAEGLLPLLRMALQCLTVDSMQTLQVKAAGLAAAMFRYYPSQRGNLLEELSSSVITYVAAGKQVARHYLVQGEDRPMAVQALVALVTQLVQVTAGVPPVDVDAQAALNCYNTPLLWADRFWQAVFSRLPTARGAKADTSLDLKSLLESMTEDLLTLQALPEWPAAAILLRRLAMLLGNEAGLKSPEPAVRLVAVELLGLLAARLCSLVKEAEAELAEVQELVAATLEASDCSPLEPPCEQSETAQQLILEHLAREARARSGASSSGAGPLTGPTDIYAAVSPAGSARELLTCAMLSERLRNTAKQLGEEAKVAEAAEAVVRYRQMHDRQRSCLGASVSDLPDLTRAEAVRVGRWLVADSILGRSRSTLLTWLAEAGGRRQADAANSAHVRTKAIKALGAAIEVDVRVLAMEEVQKGVKGALTDESVLVREAALELVGKYIGRHQDLAIQYYDVITKAADDPGITVRKRAVRLLWECCVRSGGASGAGGGTAAGPSTGGAPAAAAAEGFPYRADALARIMGRAGDPEEAMRALVTRICAEMWFLPKVTLEDEASNTSHQHYRSPEQRARQLAELAGVMYFRMGPTINVPLTSTSPLVVTLRTVLGEEGKKEYEAIRAGAQEVVTALLARVVELQGAEIGDAAATGGVLPPADELFHCLLALHALGVAAGELLVGGRDAPRLVRCLVPYLKELPQNAHDGTSRRRAEQLLCILSIVDACLGRLRHLDDGVAGEISSDLQGLIFRVPHQIAVGVACQCLCSLAALKPVHQEGVLKQAAFYYGILESECRKKITAISKYRKLYPRYMFTLGQLCRHGAALLDTKREGTKVPTCAEVLQLLLTYYHLPDTELKTKELALQSIGLVFMARPDLSVDVPEVRALLQGVLSPECPLLLKARCLTSLTELLQAEEDRLVASQKQAKADAVNAQQASTLPVAEGKGLARRNGEGDTGSVSSGLLQMLWDKVLLLAKDATPSAPEQPAVHSGNTPPPTPSGGSSGSSANVRKRALDLIEVVVRGGIVVPWSAIASLMSLATDPERDIAARALGVLHGVVANNTQYAASQVPAGVAEAYAFHRSLWQASHPARPNMPEEYINALVECLGAVWLSVFQPDKALKTKFLTAIIKPFEDASCLVSGTAARSDPYLLQVMAYVVAGLPYRKMDELLAVMARINETLSRRAEHVLARFQELRHAEQQQRAGAAAASEGGAASGARPHAYGGQTDGGGGADAAAGPLSIGGAAAAAGAGVPTSAAARRHAAAKEAAMGLAATAKAAISMSLLLWVKSYLKQAYDLTAERVAKYDPSGPQKRVEEKINAVRDPSRRFSAANLRVDVAASVSSHVPSSHGGAAAATPVPAPASALDKGVAEIYAVLKHLMKQDEADYRRADEAEDAAAAGQAGGAGGDASPGDAEGQAAVNAMMALPTATGAKKKVGRPPKAQAGARGGRGDTGGGAGRGRGRGRGRKRVTVHSDDEDDGGDEDFEVRPKTKRRLDAEL